MRFAALILLCVGPCLAQGMASTTEEEGDAGIRAIRLGNGVKFLGGYFPADDFIYERGFCPRLVRAIRGLNLLVILIPTQARARVYSSTTCSRATPREDRRDVHRGQGQAQCSAM